MTVAVAQSHPVAPADASMAELADAHRRGGLLYLVASVVAQAAALLRYIILARLLGPEQLGIAAALTVTAGFFDMVSDTGSDRFLIQDRYGGTPKVQGLVHLVHLGRGTLVAAALVIFAGPAARFYDSPPLATGLIMLAVAPLVLGWVHLDTKRMQRNHDFRSEAICAIASECVGLAAATLAAWLTHDFMAVVYGLIARVIVRVIASHIMAERPYRLGWNAESAPRLARFSTPLMLNGILLFIVSQGDRMIVGRHLGMTALGHYSTVLLLIYYPSNIVAAYTHAIFVPMIAARRDSRDDQIRYSDRMGGQTLLLTLAMAVGFAVVAPPLVPVLFGSQFTQPALLVGLIGFLQATRFFLNWPTTVALALGRSATVLTSNLVHLLIFPGAAIGLQLMDGFSGVVVGFIGAELVAAVVAVALLNRALGKRLYYGFERLGLLVLAGAAIVGWNLAIQARLWPAEAGMCLASAALLIRVYCREADVFTEMLGLARRSLMAMVGMPIRK